ncbi:MAG: hypothetical protein ACP5H2_06365 [Solirubrobacteraceae bacterium]
MRTEHPGRPASRALIGPIDILRRWDAGRNARTGRRRTVTGPADVMRRRALLPLMLAGALAWSCVVDAPYAHAASVHGDSAPSASVHASSVHTSPVDGPVDVVVGRQTVSQPAPAGFVGLATEFWDVESETGTNPAAPDTPFEQALRNLSPDGGIVLRIGGDSTDWSWWPIAGMTQPVWVRFTITPTWLAVTQKLAEDLQAHLILGINMEANSTAIAQAEEKAMQAGIGPSVPITFELGNEPIFYSKWPFYHTPKGRPVTGRPKSYSWADVTRQWHALAASLGPVSLAGPGFPSWHALSALAPFLNANRNLHLVTLHTYATRSPECHDGGTVPESALFTPAALQNLGLAVSAWAAVAHHHRVALRVDEINAVTCGGLVPFSRSFGPSLWALNILPLYMEAGVTGVNFESKPNTAQNLIQPSQTSTGAWQVAVQPEYYGMLAFAQVTPPGSRLLKISGTPDGLYAWAVRTPQEQTHVVLTNVGAKATRFVIKAAGASGPTTVEALKAASGKTTATTGVTLGGQTISPTTGQLVGTPVLAGAKFRRSGYVVTVPGATAEIVSFKG